MNYQQYIATGVATIGLLMPVSVGASTQKGLERGDQATRVSAINSRERCEDQGRWIFNEIIPDVRLKMHTALVSPNNIKISMIPDPFGVELFDYVKITTIDGGGPTQEPIHLNLPNPVTRFDLEIGESGGYTLSIKCEQ